MNKTKCISYILLFLLIQPIHAQAQAVPNRKQQAIVLGKGLGWSLLALLSCIVTISQIDCGISKFYNHKDSWRRKNTESNRPAIMNISDYPEGLGKLGFFPDRLEVAYRTAIYNEADVIRSMIITVCAGLVSYYAARNAIELFYQLHNLRTKRTEEPKKSISLRKRYELNF